MDNNTRKFIENITKRFNELGVSSSTQKSYISILKNIRKNMLYKGTSLMFIKDFEGIDRVLENKSLSYKVSAYSAFVKLSKNKKIKKRYSLLMKILNKSKLENLKDNKMNNKEVASIGGLTFSDLLKILPLIKEDMKENKECECRFYYSYQYYILSMMYLKCHFLPRLDYCSVKVIYDKSLLNGIDNQLLVEDGVMTIYFNSFKNIKKIGKMEFKLCEEVREEIEKWLLYKENINSDDLFYNMKKEKVYNNKRFSELIKRMFLKFLNRPIGANCIRKLKEISIQSNPEYHKLTLKQKEDIHKEVFHSKGIAELCYNKCNTIVEEVEEIAEEDECEC